MKKKCVIAIIGLVSLFSISYALTVDEEEEQAQNEKEERRRAFTAQKWAEAFGALDISRNITIRLWSHEFVCEIENVKRVDPKGRFLVVQYMGQGGGTYRALVHPETILLIKEASREPEKKAEKPVQSSQNAPLSAGVQAVKTNSLPSPAPSSAPPKAIL